MQTSLGRRRSRLARPLSWLVVAGLASAALIGPGAGGVGAGGDTEPGAPDFVPNSGHTSSAGLTLAMGTATIDCDGDSVNSLSGSFTFSGNSAGDHVVLYLAANNGSNADPLGNVQDNEVSIDLDGQTSPVSFSIPITSPFTASKGGVLIVFASDVAGSQSYSSKSNSLNCSDSTTTSTTTTTDTSTTDTSTTDTSTTETSTTETSTETSSETTDTSSETTDTSSETTDTSSETTDTSSETTDTSSETTDTSSETTDTSSETTDTSSETTETSSETTQTSTGSESGTESSTTTTSSSTGEELGATGTPGLTPPTTDTIGTASVPASPDGFRFVLLGLAFLLAMGLLLQPRDVKTRK
jgi:hypothetical protein